MPTLPTLSLDQLLSVRAAYVGEDSPAAHEILSQVDREVLWRVQRGNPYTADYPTVPSDLSLFRKLPYPPKELHGLAARIRWMLEAHPMHLYAPFVDKYAVLEYVRNHAPQLVLEPLAVFHYVDDYIADTHFYQKPYVLKATNGCSDLVTVGNPLDGAQVAAAIRGVQRQFTATQVAHREVQYAFPPRVVLQPLLRVDGELQFFCFNGEPRMFLRLCGAAKLHRQGYWYTAGGGYIGVHGTPASDSQPPELPDQFEWLNDAARKLSEPFQQVRVDFMCSGNGACFSELTFSTRGGIISSPRHEVVDQIANQYWRAP